MSKEENSYRNPIRVSVNTGGANLFKNQKPGLHVSDVTGDGYYCTTFKTSKDEPVWAKEIDDGSGPKVLPVYFVFVSIGKDKTVKTITKSGTQFTYTQSDLQKRNKYNTLNDKNRYGSYVFIGLSTSEIERITGTSQTSSSSSSVDEELSDAVVKSPANIRALYDFMSTDSNGRTGTGSTATTATGMGSAANRTDIYGNSGFGATSSFIGTVAGRTTESSASPPNPNPSSSTTPRTSSSRGSSKKPATYTKPEPISIKIGENKIRQNGNSSKGFNDDEKRPYIEQVYFVYENNVKSKVIRRHVFDIIPNSFEFSQLSSTWNNVERSGNYPLVDWSAYNLTKVSFRFLVHGRRIDSYVVNDRQTINTTVNDGLDVSIDDQIDNLRSIGGAPAPLRVYNMNTLLTDSYRYPYLQKGGNIQWVIADMSVTASRLTPEARNIAAAEVSITLQEFPVISRDIIRLPPLSPTSGPKPNIPGIGTPASYDAWVGGTYTIKPTEEAEYTSAKST